MATMDSLPTELLLHILSYLDSEAPSDGKFYAEPSADLTCSLDQPLKALSRVSWLWRRLVGPLLFRHVRVGVGSQLSEKSMDDFLAFMERRELQCSMVETLVVYSDEACRSCVQAKELNEEGVRMFKTVSRQLNPISLKILAPPRTMFALFLEDYASGLEEWFQDFDEWAFDMPYHILELRQDAVCKTSHGRDQSSLPFQMRNWTRLGYNEGSSLKAYSTYEFQWKRSPPILPAILCETGLSSVPSTLRSFTYIAIFPLGTHVETLNQLPPHPYHAFRSFELQFAPQARSNIIDDPVRMGRAQASDLWLEHHRSVCEFLNIVTLIEGAVDVTLLDYSCPVLSQGLDRVVEKLEQNGFRKVGAIKWAKE